MGTGDGVDNILEQLSSTKLQFLDFGDEMSNLLEILLEYVRPIYFSFYGKWACKCFEFRICIPIFL
jgi:hypothetical protein